MTDRKVTLGGKDYTFKPLTLGQMKAIGIGSAKQQKKSTDPAAEEANWYDGMFDILAAALGKSVEDVQKIEGATLTELIAANREILDSVGLIRVAQAAGGAPGGAAGTTG